MGLGFVVARFGFFIQLVNPTHPDAGRLGFSNVLGVCLAMGGGILTALAGLQFIAFLRELKPEELPRARLAKPVSLVLAFAVSGVGVLLGVYLLHS